MQVVVDRAGGAPSTSVPVFDSGEVDPQQLWNASKLPGEMLEQLEASGQTVVRQRHFMSLHLEDGRQVIIPVERIQIVPYERIEY